MPITKSAQKALHGSKNKKLFNDRRARAMKGEIKEIKKMTDAKDAKGAKDKLADAYKAIDKAAKRGIIKKNTAARKKSRLVKMIKNVS
ncbi:MAG: 30S ribosomal protein S20 [Candidatus Paceibacterota bacterium]|jgi:small subunit ribosomal protein S20